MKHLRLFENFENDNLTFSSPEEFIAYWTEHWKGTDAENFPVEFLENFPTNNDYSEFEKDEYDYEDDDDEWDFSPEDEVFNIAQQFNIGIGDSPDDDITTDDWVDFYNSVWTWE